MQISVTSDDAIIENLKFHKQYYLIQESPINAYVYFSVNVRNFVIL